MRSKERYILKLVFFPLLGSKIQRNDLSIHCTKLHDKQLQWEIHSFWYTHHNHL